MKLDKCTLIQTKHRIMPRAMLLYDSYMHTKVEYFFSLRHGWYVTKGYSIEFLAVDIFSSVRSNSFEHLILYYLWATWFRIQ